jgi:hypothetical protein
MYLIEMKEHWFSINFNSVRINDAIEVKTEWLVHWAPAWLFFCFRTHIAKVIEKEVNANDWYYGI